MAEQPTQSGWYWARWPDGDFEIVSFDHERKEVYVAGDEMPYKMEEFVEWIGPLSVPGAETKA